ncbi:Kinase, CAMK CAMKL [Aduncisulcus paluster]|uniref:non-specific serine/threonine protein kinase n=1 Tax=Aduncisulcus paluster TaxID=2918883 RepID=A0ABQ5K0R6_9EUKA|nr:Kinase, CAMK CAMKL [Aduncisulcus paluster]|eukprot:gnl/Carplike_NY0171/2091_a2814_828.p1 GENE.gnl/Carplike_NY0171/2091_a2814_828~~gnl/Carplike_NY0171/2091_a2814_828.p1  ORF type:complete len:612 (-),score=158.89 gnl/Carplike_NY0171/2091_a2814_828:611-2446(-)
MIEKIGRGTRIGDYVLGKTIGEGTFGRVRLATHVPTGEKVAMKILEKSQMKDKTDLERVNREISIMKHLNHPNIVKLLQVFTTPHRIFLVLEHVTGGELFDHIVKHTRIAEPEACNFFHQIVNGMSYCHKRGVIHRDLKPENLLLDERNSIKIADFGLSNTYKQGQYLHTACGSPAYASPEMIANKAYAGEMSDIWSSGVVLYALLCGYLPFDDPDASRLYDKVLNGRFSIPPFVSAGARSLLKSILITDPRKRATVDMIRKHPWYVQTYTGPKEAPDDTQRSLHLDFDIVQKLRQYDFPPSEVINALNNGKHDRITAAYWLIYMREKKKAIRRAKSKSFRFMKPLELPKLDMSKKKKKKPEDATSDKPKGAPDTPAESSASPSHAVDGKETDSAVSHGLDEAIAPGTPSGTGYDIQIHPPPATDSQAHRKKPESGEKVPASPTVSKPPAQATTLAVPGKQRPHRPSLAGYTQNSAQLAAKEVRYRRATVIAGVAPEMASQSQRKEAEGQAIRKKKHKKKGTITLNASPGQNPKVILASLLSCLTELGITHTQERTYAMQCSDKLLGVAFQAEVCRVQGREKVYVVRLRIVSGEQRSFDIVAQRISDVIKL